ncbi:BCCT family transporter [Salibacterium qingdaonense]|uniref:BCCT family transporter n=1 Tax=Salibacterium qingdaonense TaxID=266892 RepID=UPI0015A57896
MGLHPWALYGIAARGSAYFHFPKDLPSSMSSIFHPLNSIIEYRHYQNEYVPVTAP